MKKLPPIVSVSAVTTSKEVRGIASVFSENEFSLDSTHIPAIGFLVSKDPPEKRPLDMERYASIDQLPALLEEANGKTLRIIHFESGSTESIGVDIIGLLQQANNKCDALQLNVEFNDSLLAELSHIKEHDSSLSIILQLRSSLIDENEASTVAKTIKNVVPFIDGVLIDASCGKGLQLDVAKASQLYTALQEQYPQLGIGFAGGLSGDNLHEIIQSLTNNLSTQEFSIDAESQLREAEGTISLEKVGAYIRAASSLL